MLIFDSAMEHEVLSLVNVSAATPAAKKAKRKRRVGDKTPPRCAVTQWFQDLNPPLMRSSVAALEDEQGASESTR